ncbi:hypothetical protein [Pedobacter alluvionis]|uniref:Uncharacterized protein n=1 Tax=Pedobacter alluvionis TaxID=475253 RepID=A0A497Y7E8_9SPHI|nr:hypothetical protein [Pedobacter alluvionis]RLJ79474.1 hypothetical protein BCL90_0171 [Pedobacter alluvionis]TFB30822.1 hypothetical protein E3V97_09290 [Pedobacter alluvionis]
MEEVLKKLEVDSRIIDLAMGRIPLYSEYSGYKYFGKLNNEKSFPQPPFFIPIVINYDGTPVSYGIINHWFADRKSSYGDMDFANEFDVGEFALTADQFLDSLLTEEYDNLVEEGNLNEVKRVFKSSASIDLLQDLSKNEAFNNSDLPSFFNFKPIGYFTELEQDLYKGTFPTNNEILIERNLNKASYFEIAHKEWIGYIEKKSGFSLFKKKSPYEAAENVPEWLKPKTNKQQLFDKYVSNNEYDKAWLTINGPGFTPKEVGERLQQLKAYSNEEAYHLWVDFWCKKYGDTDTFIFI